MGQKTWGPFNGRQLTVIAVALIIGVVALPGAVWAVDTFSNVAIEDPVTGVKASVNNAHQVLVNGKVVQTPPAQVLNSASFIFEGLSVMFGPTTATLAIDRLAVMNTEANYCCPNTSFYVSLHAVQGNTASDCYSNTLPNPRAEIDSSPGTNVEQSFATPLVFKPQSSSAKYCVMIFVSNVGAAPDAYYAPFTQLNGYVVAGTYAGPGASAPAAAGAADTGDPLASSPGGSPNQPEYLPPVSSTGKPLPTSGPPPLVKR